MPYITEALNMTVVEEGEAADLRTVSDALDKIDAFAGDIATVEESPSVAAHDKGELLVYAGHLYKVTAAIAIGDSLTLGTNVTPANVGTELSTLRTDVDTLQDSVLPIQGRASGDFNDLTTTGVYYTQNTMTANKPADNVYGYIFVCHFDITIAQVVVNANHDVYCRHYSGAPASWGSWASLHSQIEYTLHQVTCNSTSGSTAWDMTANKAGYYPIGYEIYHSHSSSWVAGAETVNPSLGTIFAKGFYSPTGGNNYVMYLRVTWMKA